MKKGKFIVLEGLDLTGKTSVLNTLREKIQEEKLQDDFIFTREPGGASCELSEKIREFILNNDFSNDPITEAYLFASARANHVQRIKKWIDEGKTVICDRFVYSSYFYQGEKIGSYKIKTINEIALDGLEPDAIFYLVTDNKERLRRYNLRNEINELDNRYINNPKAEADYFFAIVSNYSYSDYLFKVDTTNLETDKYAEFILDEIKNL